jgi:hypothetical protein
VKSATFLSLSKKPEAGYTPCSQLVQNGTETAPSFSDFEGSRNASGTKPLLRPRPLHSGHMPCGSLNENAFE